MSQKFECAGSTYSIDQAINGQTPLAFYDSLAQIALRPSLREGTVLCYNKQGLEGLLAQIQALLKADNRVVRTNPYYWTEFCQEETITVSVKKAAGAVPAAGAQVTVQIDDSSHSSNGKFSKPRAGYRAYIKENKLQGANIISVNKTVTGAHTMTLEPINGEVLDLTGLATYTLVVDTLRMYKKGDTDCITKSGLIQNPPILRKGYVQKFEDGIFIHEDEIDGYAYESEFHVVKGLDPITGRAVDMWAIPQVNSMLQAKLIDSININTLIGRRDDVKQEGYDGLITTADAQGMFNAGYDPASGVSFRQILLNMVRTLRKTQGCTDYMLAHDFGFGMDWTEGIASMVKEAGQGTLYALFGNGGAGVRDFQMYGFKDFSAFNYKFRTFQIDMFDSIRYGSLLPNFALMLPACTFKDTNGKVVPPVTYVTIEGSEPAKTKNMWVDDTRKRGCRTVDFYIKHNSGMEIHCASKLGVLRKKTS
jgi:hypothetical protein